MRLLPALAILFAAPALAAPRVATDIAPVHSIAAQVMAGVGEPDLLIQIGASPHGYALRPSEAQALQDAEVVFWIGEGLTPWLERGIDNLAADATVVELLGAGGSTMLPNRDTAIFEHDDDHHDDDHHDDHAKDDDHDEHKHDDHADEEGRDEHKHDEHAHEDGHDDDKHDEHAHKDDDHHDDDHDEHANEGGHDHHDHGENDPHAWLDPKNAEAWADVIAATLSKADPANAAVYTANAAATKARLASEAADVASKLDTVRGKKFVVFHDAYQYFETRFDMPSAGAISIGDARKPSPARLVEIREYVQNNDVACVFAEPQFDAGVVNAVAEGANVRSGVMDPLGSAHAQGPAFYGALMQGLAASMVDCLSD